jgi:hypothetical protein
MVAQNITLDSTKRQVELNQWEYSYKINSLFMMQFIFIALNIMIVFMCLYKYGFFKLPFIVFVYIVILIIIIFVAVIRDRAFNHDDRYWTKLNFPSDGKLVSNISPDYVASVASQQQTQCVDTRGPTGSQGPAQGVAMPLGPTGPNISSYYNMYQNLNSLFGATGNNSNYRPSNRPNWLSDLGFT